MKHIKRFILMLIFVAFTGFIGCTAIEKSDAMDTERLLSAAGFQMKFSDTPDKLANIKAMTQRKVVPHEKDGTVYYAYADAEFCKCLYLGSERAYQQYEKLAIQQSIAQMNQSTATMGEGASMNWDAWGGGWGPSY